MNKSLNDMTPAEMNREFAERADRLQECYDKFKHLDILLSDKDWYGDDPRSQILYELWQAIKAAQEGK